MNTWIKLYVSGGVITLLALPVYHGRVARHDHGVRDVISGPRYVGYQSCIECHEESYKAWKGSDHERAMDIASEATVLGNFNDTTFVGHQGKVTRFFRDNGKFMVQAEGEAGKPASFEITHVFGHDPLQQYLVPFPGGRLQCLTIAWDRIRGVWYDLYANQDMPAGDWLHWTGRAQTWNTMCAECHSTNLEKTYDPVADTYHTTWSDINVSCEACHGPGSGHIAWAKRPRYRRDEDPTCGLVVQTSGLTTEQFVNQCALCHSRRQTFHDLAPGNREFTDHAALALFREGVYYADGQVLDEDYEYGSFLQSKMYHRDVRCSDCHDSHSLQPRYTGNQLCTQCHRVEEYDSPAHHFHQLLVDDQPNPGAQCVGCHMPERVYMGIDWRADHSIRVPRPDLTEATGSPDACSRCHTNRPLSFSVEAFRRWYGEKTKPHFGTVLARARRGDEAALGDLIAHTQDRLLPDILRASSMAEAGHYVDRIATDAIVAGLRDESALVRRTSVESLRADSLPLEQLVEALVPLLNDPVLGVRIAVVPVLAGWYDRLDARARASFDATQEEYRKAMLYTADMPGSRHNLGNLASSLGDIAAAEYQYRQALRLDEKFVPAGMNLALLLNQQGRNEEARRLLQKARVDHPEFGEAAYSLGLLLAEMRDYAGAMTQLRDAVRLMPEHARAHYNLGQLADFQKQDDEAARELERAVDLMPQEQQFLMAAAEYYLRHGRKDDARRIFAVVEKHHAGTALHRDLQHALSDLAPEP